ncbi:MAG: HigA family addiction module antidote protein [Clostridiales bacterium]|nr:HigA family addiction module antidote protein [Clostridiales bacterium]
MARTTNTIGLSRDLIIHPGETLAELLEDREMSQRELAIRTGVTEKHISTVISGYKNISPVFARRLEYALGIKASFWMDLQANYDRELLLSEEINSISDEELAVLDNLKEVTSLWTSWGWIQKSKDPNSYVLDYRLMLGISNLLDTPKIFSSAAQRVLIENSKADPYVLLAWQRMCEILTRDITSSKEVDTEKLRSKIANIKKTMFLDPDKIPDKLCAIFKECGIAFRTVPTLNGAPVRGFIKKTGSGSIILCIPVKDEYTDLFWFSLFREIAHIINEDTKREYIDCGISSDRTEKKADKAAFEYLIDNKDYKVFIENEEYLKPHGIETFAESQKVRDFIIRRKLISSGLIDE